MKKHLPMRSVPKDTPQRNKSLTGFVKCTSCVKYACGVWNALRRVRDLFHFTLRSNISQLLCDYFTFAVRQIFHLKHQLSRKTGWFVCQPVSFYLSAHLLTTFCGGYLTNLSFRTLRRSGCFFHQAAGIHADAWWYTTTAKPLLVIYTPYGVMIRKLRLG